MEHFDLMKTQLIAAIENQLANLQCADYEELGAAIDMVKDLEEAKYYCTITEAMEKSKENNYEIEPRYFTEPMASRRDMDMSRGRTYYDNNDASMREWNSDIKDTNIRRATRNGDNSERDYPMLYRDEREGRSPMRRKNYMESKMMHKDKSATMQELEDYAQGLTTDIIEMIKDATPEEKQMLQQKITMLANKIV